MVDFPKSFYFVFIVHIVVLQPPNRRNDQGLGCSAFARHYLRNHYCFLFLRVLRCFSSPGLPLSVTVLQTAGLPHSEIFGYSGYVHLPEAYRSLSRPSSPLEA